MIRKIREQAQSGDDVRTAVHGNAGERGEAIRRKELRNCDSSAKLGNQAIGAAGESFVQYHLIKRGIDSARLTTDSGIDLAMYIPRTREAHTIQVKATSTNYPFGPDSPPQLWWPFPVTCTAHWLAVVDLPRDLAWMLPIEDVLLAWTDDARLMVSRVQAGPQGPTLAERYAWWSSHS